MYRIAIYKSTIYIDWQNWLANHFRKIIYIDWQKIMANHFERLYVIIAIYTNWQKCKANLLKFKHTIIDNYRCKIEWKLAHKNNYRTQL